MNKVWLYVGGDYCGNRGVDLRCDHDREQHASSGKRSKSGIRDAEIATRHRRVH
jgi:hypothetical protein